MTLPTPPTPPGADAEPAVIAQWECDMRYWEALAKVESIAASDRHGKAQQATADAMNRYSDIVGDMPAQAPLTRQALTLELLKRHPHVTGLTDLNVVDNCIKAADAFLTRFPQGAS